VVILIGAYSVFWFQMASKIEESTLAWLENNQKTLDGLKIFTDDVSVSGYPYRIIVKTSSVHGTIPEGQYSSLPISFTIPEVSVVYHPWKPNHAVIVTDYFDVVFGSIENPTETVEFENVKSSVILEPDTLILKNLSIISDKVSWFEGVTRIADNISVMEKPEFHFRKMIEGMENENSYDLPIFGAVSFKAFNLNVKDVRTGIFASKATEVTLESILHANQNPELTASALSKWRDEGGTLTVRTFDYKTDDYNLKLSGDITLDENLKPLGAFDAHISGIKNLIGKMTDNGETSTVGQIMLNNQAQNTELKETVELSISMQNGYLYIGPIPLMELSPIVE
jgi:hypothetical protein